jgi:hypothetical protein
LRTKTERHPKSGGAPRQEACTVNATELWPALTGIDDEARRRAVRTLAVSARTKFQARDRHSHGRGPMSAANVKTRSVDKSKMPKDGGPKIVSGGLPELGRRR